MKTIGEMQTGLKFGAVPWRWEHDGRNGFNCWRLLDAGGNILVEGPIDRDYDDGPTARVRILTAAAPEMEVALRVIQVDADGGLAEPGGTRAAIGRIRLMVADVLVRLDEAAKGGG